MRLKIKLTIFGIFLLLCLGCNEPPPDNEIIPTWTTYEFAETPFRMRIFRSYLYAFNYGLWRMNIERDDAEWEKISLPDPSSHPMGIYDVLVNDKDNSILIAYPEETMMGHGLYKSTDDGVTWFPSDSGMLFEDLQVINDKPRGLLATPDGILAGGMFIWKSVDNGETWSSVVSTGVYFLDLTSHPSSLDIIWGWGMSALLESFVFKSEDGGETWSTVRFEPPYDLPSPFLMQDLAFDNENDSLVYISMNAPRILITENGGKTWSHPVVIDSTVDADVYMLWANPGKSGHVIAGLGSDIYESLDYGKNWEMIENPIENTIYSKVYDPVSHTLYLGTESTIYAYNIK